MGLNLLRNQIGCAETEIGGTGGQSWMKGLVKIHLMVNPQAITSKTQVVKAGIFKQPNHLNLLANSLLKVLQPATLKRAAQRA
jgi:hypothetical protein